MRWIRFTTAERTCYGVIEGDRIAEADNSPFEGWKKTGRTHALDAVKIEIPVIPRTFYAAGLNYAAHVTHAAHLLGNEPDLPEKPDIGYRANNALIAHDEEVIIPRDATAKVQYEGELVVVIGKKAKNLSEAEALSCVLGYTIGNDVSERTWQRSDRTLWRAKNTNTFKPMGPWIETSADLDAMQTTVRLNGAVRTTFKTNDMLFGVARYISATSKYITLWPGDVMWMGTDGASPDLVHNDLVEVEITGIGSLRNRFVREA